MPSTYQIFLQMNAATVSSLYASGFVLWAMVPIQCSDKAALPTAWQRVQNYLENTTLSWSLDVLGYTSLTPLQAGATVVPGFSAPIKLGQVLNVADGGVGKVSSNGIPGTVAFVNSVATQFTCGLALPVNNSPVPIGAAPLYGNNVQFMAPTSQVFLMFSNRPTTPGEIVVTSSGPGMLADFAVANAQTLTVNYDINAGWTWGGFAWGSACPPLSNLQQLLVQPPGSAQLAAEDRWRKHFVARAKHLPR
jgi:hypothetical protein